MAVNDEQAYKLKRKNIKFLWQIIVQRLALKADSSTVTNLATTVGNKVDKIAGKGLSTNDYTDADKAIVNSMAATGVFYDASTGRLYIEDDSEEE